MRETTGLTLHGLFHNIKLNRIIQTAILTLGLLLAAAPGLAEAPTAEPPTTEAAEEQQNNIRRLILTNECAGCNFEGADFTEAHLIGADLRNTNLQWANFTDANLEGADFEGANLTGANFTRAFLTDTYLANTLLIDVNFTGAHLYNTDVTGATLENITLVGADVYNTPINIGGHGPTDNEPPPPEPIIPLEETQPPILYPETLVDPIL